MAIQMPARFGQISSHESDRILWFTFYLLVMSIKQPEVLALTSSISSLISLLVIAHHETEAEATQRKGFAAPE